MLQRVSERKTPTRCCGAGTAEPVTGARHVGRRSASRRETAGRSCGSGSIRPHKPQAGGTGCRALRFKAHSRGTTQHHERHVAPTLGPWAGSIDTDPKTGGRPAPEHEPPRIGDEGQRWGSVTLAVAAATTMPAVAAATMPAVAAATMPAVAVAMAVLPDPVVEDATNLHLRLLRRTCRAAPCFCSGTTDTTAPHHDHQVIKATIRLKTLNAAYCMNIAPGQGPRTRRTRASTAFRRLIFTQGNVHLCPGQHSGRPLATAPAPPGPSGHRSTPSPYRRGGSGSRRAGQGTETDVTACRKPATWLGRRVLAVAGPYRGRLREPLCRGASRPLTRARAMSAPVSTVMVSFSVWLLAACYRLDLTPSLDNLSGGVARHAVWSTSSRTRLAHAVRRCRYSSARCGVAGWPMRSRIRALTSSRAGDTWPSGRGGVRTGR